MRKWNMYMIPCIIIKLLIYTRLLGRCALSVQGAAVCLPDACTPDVTQGFLHQ